MAYLKVAAATAALIMALAAPAHALTSTAIVNVPSAPVHISQCIAGTRDSDAGNVDYYWDFGAVFSNLRATPVAAVRLRFDVYDAFGERLRTYYGIDDDGLAANGTTQDVVENAAVEQRNQGSSIAGVPIFTPTWEFINTAETGKTVLCSLDTVMVGDTKWSAPPLSSADVRAALKRATSAQGIFYKPSDD